MDWGWNMMSLDKGSVIAGSHSMPVAEIEHDSEDGNRGGLLPLARKMSSIVPAEMSTKSIAECGYGLSERGKCPAVMLTEIVLSLSAAAAVASAFRSHFLAIVELSGLELIACALRGRAEERAP
jgi:inorganic triphosphatase YgiF